MGSKGRESERERELTPYIHVRWSEHPMRAETNKKSERKSNNNSSKREWKVIPHTETITNRGEILYEQQVVYRMQPMTVSHPMGGASYAYMNTDYFQNSSLLLSIL